MGKSDPESVIFLQLCCLKKLRAHPDQELYLSFLRFLEESSCHNPKSLSSLISDISEAQSLLSKYEADTIFSWYQIYTALYVLLSIITGYVHFLI